MTEPTRPEVRRCAIRGCIREARSRGWCQGHYMRWFVCGDTMDHKPLPPARECDVEGCERDTYGHGLCPKHYYRIRRHGDPTKTVNAIGFVRLDAAPLIAAVEATGRPVVRLGDRDRRTFYRARRRGWVNDHSAERILAVVGLTLDEVYGPAWDEAGAA